MKRYVPLMLLASASIAFAQHQLGATLIGHTSDINNWATVEEKVESTIETDNNDFASSIKMQPFKARGYVEIQAAEIVTDVRLFDQYGKERLYSKPNATLFKINADTLPKGTYLVLLTSSSNQATLRLAW